jgi:hypothetical protein
MQQRHDDVSITDSSSIIILFDVVKIVPKMIHREHRWFFPHRWFCKMY